MGPPTWGGFTRLNRRAGKFYGSVLLHHPVKQGLKHAIFYEPPTWEWFYPADQTGA